MTSLLKEYLDNPNSDNKVEGKSLLSKNKSDLYDTSYLDVERKKFDTPEKSYTPIESGELSSQRLKTAGSGIANFVDQVVPDYKEERSKIGQVHKDDLKKLEDYNISRSISEDRDTSKDISNLLAQNTGLLILSLILILFIFGYCWKHKKFLLNIIYPKINHSYTINRAITIILWVVFSFITWMYFTDSGFEIYRDALSFYYDEDGFHWIILLLSFPFLFSFLQRILYFVIYGKDKTKWQIEK